MIDEFIKDLKNTGAVAPCSSEVAKAMIGCTELSKCKTVVELGSGTGAITEKLLQNISKETLFLALEVNPLFVKETKKKCPKAIVYHDSAENIKHYLEKHGQASCDCIISTLPWTLFSKEVQQNILRAITDVLKPGGEFLTVAYTFAGFLPAGIRFKNMLKGAFSIIERTKPIWKNLPPAYVYHCQK